MGPVFLPRYTVNQTATLDVIGEAYTALRITFEEAEQLRALVIDRHCDAALKLLKELEGKA